MAGTGETMHKVLVLSTGVLDEDENEMMLLDPIRVYALLSDALKFYEETTPSRPDGSEPDAENFEEGKRHISEFKGYIFSDDDGNDYQIDAVPLIGSVSGGVRRKTKTTRRRKH
jgi:hypothetical protein